MATSKKQTGLRLNEEMHAKIKYLSEKDGRTINNFVELILRQYLESYEREHGKIPVNHQD